VNRVAEEVAKAFAGALSRFAKAEAAATAIRVLDALDDALPLPAALSRAPLGDEPGCESVLVMGLEPMRAVAATLYGGLGAEDDLPASAVCEVAGELSSMVLASLLDRIGGSLEIGAGVTKVVEDAAEIGPVPEGATIVRFAIEGSLPLEVVHVVPAALADRLQSAEPVGAEAAGPSDPALAAVERAAGITADAAQAVLSTLMQGKVEASSPTIESDPRDPLDAMAYPFLAVEVSYVAGVAGTNLFALTTDQVARLASAMMGVTEIGLGTSEIEVSAASEAMNQVMGAATRTMADALSIDIDISPPRSQLINSADEARAQFGEWAYVSRFRLSMADFSADVVQLVAPEFAEDLRRAFAGADEKPGEKAPKVALAMPALPDPTAEPARPGTFTGDLLRSTTVRVSAELGRARVPVGRLGNLRNGSIVELDRAVDEAIDIRVNGQLYARGKLLLVDGEYAVQVISIAQPDHEPHTRSFTGGTSAWHE
jgi:flagellar motor switch protein FliN/FliY